MAPNCNVHIAVVSSSRRISLLSDAAEPIVCCHYINYYWSHCEACFIEARAILGHLFICLFKLSFPSLRSGNITERTDATRKWAQIFDLNEVSLRLLFLKHLLSLSFNLNKGFLYCIYLFTIPCFYDQLSKQPHASIDKLCSRKIEDTRPFWWTLSANLMATPRADLFIVDIFTIAYHW